MRTLSETHVARFWSRVDIHGPNGCWIWTAGKTGAGHGRFFDGVSERTAHRIAWEMLRGEIEPGFLVCHNCPGGDVPACVNPNHMFLGTMSENTMDRCRKGRTARGDRNGSHKAAVRRRLGLPPPPPGRGRGWNRKPAPTQADIDLFWSRVDIRAESECWEWMEKRTRYGYGQASLLRRPRAAHRIAWMFAVGAIPDGLWVLHRCDNRLCCNPAHLFLGTAQDNVADKMAKGRQSRGPEMHKNRRHPQGARNGRAKLTPEDVENIRCLANILGAQRVGNLYGVAKPQILRIWYGDGWKISP